jgi:hypothetical protein
MGLGTVASDLFVIIIVNGMLRKRFTKGRRPWVWRAVHVTTYAAWPFAILHGLLAGRHAKPYVDWSYGACLAMVALALTFRYIVLARGRNAADPGYVPRPSATSADRILRQVSPPQPAGYQAGYQPGRYLPAGYQATPPLRALPPGTGAVPSGPASPGRGNSGPHRFLPPEHDQADLDYGQPWTQGTAAYSDGGPW